jgi:hypothetical protein
MDSRDWRKSVGVMGGLVREGQMRIRIMLTR